MYSENRRHHIAELAVLGLTLAVTLFASAYVYRQTQRHFEVERTTYFIERFNRSELVKTRRAVDLWLDSGESAETLFQRSAAKDAAALETIETLRVFANFFQELAAAMRHESLDDEYLWDVFGFIASDYGRKLQPFIHEIRRAKGREKLYQDFDDLIQIMVELETKYSDKSTANK